MAGSIRVASATSAYESGYGFERTWNAAVRFIRVDRGYKLIEKDESTGYLLFEYTSGQSASKASLGSFEIVRANDDVRVMVALKEMPSHHEQALISAFSAKLRAEYGEPLRRRKERDKPMPEDGGVDGE
jgi:hypothetical protein